MQIYLARNQVQAGPYTLTELNNMLATGQVELSDLMWHTGMEQWKPVSEMTQGQFHYNPTASTPPSTPSKRVSVAKLYGKKEPESDLKHIIDLSKSTPSSTHNKHHKIQSFKNTTDELATISNRVLAVIIDQALALLCLVPLLSGLNFDFEKLSTAAQDFTVLNQMAESIPSHLALMTGLFMIALIMVQIFMLIRRGQSIGKLITGVRILDSESKTLPSVTNIVLIRTILTNLAYNIPTIGQIILIADFVIMVTNKQRRSLHDKFAKTIVVKAKPDQLQK